MRQYQCQKCQRVGPMESYNKVNGNTRCECGGWNPKWVRGEVVKKADGSLDSTTTRKASQKGYAPGAVEIRTLKPGRAFAYAYDTRIMGELVRVSDGSAIVALKYDEETFEFDEESGTDVKTVKTRREKSHAIAPNTMVIPKKHRSK